jgi:hypothetical protein
MKVSELIKALSELDPDAEVVMSSDAEGNGFSPLSDVTEGWYEADSTWSGEFGCCSDGCDNDQACTGEENAVALWPVN